MSFKEKLSKYAQLIVKAGLNVQPAQIVVIDAPVESVELVRLVTKEAYAAGAREVVVKYNDEVVSRYKYKYLEKEAFAHVPTWFKEFRNDYAAKKAAFLTIISDDPEGFKGIDPAKIALWSKSVSTACKPFYDSLDLGINTWCIVAGSSIKWANKVYPDMSDSEAVEALWNAIFKAVKVVDDDPLTAWQEHRKSFEARVAYLNKLNLNTLTYTNSLGTNLTVDDGSLYLGEIALVPYDSPISNMKTLFYNTLFDENASCHLAIGKGFSECIQGGLTMTKEQLLEKGVNDSLTHVDFMIGTSDLKIVGETKDGQVVRIFENGNFVF